MQDDATSPKAKGSRTQELVLSELLVLRARGGDSQAFGQLVKLWQEPLWRHAYRLTGREDAAWDVLQESWLGIGKGLSGLRDASLFKRWAYTIVTRASVARIRRQPLEEVQEFESLDLHPQPQEGDDREHALFQLRRAMEQLKREDRVLVSLHYLENFELWELAKILDTPEGTLKSRLHRIRHRLKELLERMNHE